MKLIVSLTSPYARKVRIVLQEKRIECALVVDIPWNPDTEVAHFNPLGKVPVLVLDDGSTLFDSRVIVDYLDHISPFAKLIPTEHRAATQVKRWEALADGVLDAAISVFLERKRPTAQQSTESMQRSLGKVDQGLAALANDLGERNWCYGEAFGLADIAVGCCLDWLAFRFPEIGWRERHLNLARLADKLAQRPAFADTIPQA